MLALFMITGLLGPTAELPAATRIASSYDWLCVLNADAIRCQTPMDDRSLELKGEFVDLAVSLGVCGLTRDGAIKCAALPRKAGKTPHAAPVAPKGRFTALFSNRRYTCALDDAGKPACFGEVMRDLVPHPTTGTPETIVGAAAGCKRVGDRWDCWPYALPEPTVAWTALAIGGRQICGLTPAGAVTCQDTAWRPPTAVYKTMAPKTGRFVRLVGDPELLACALDADGHAQCFGKAFDISKAAAPPAKVQFTRLAIDGYEACGLDKQGAAHCFGAIVKYDGKAPLKTPAKGPFVDLSIKSSQSACGATAAGAVHCWGESADPKITTDLGTGPIDGWAHASSTVCVLRAGRVLCGGPHRPEGTPTETDFIRIASTQSVLCGLRKTGQVKCWGAAYELENDSFQPEPTDVVDMRIEGLGLAFMRDGTLNYWTGGAVVSAPSVPFKDLALGDVWMCGRTVDDQAHCWGVSDAHWTGKPVTAVGGQCVADADGVHCWRNKAAGFKHVEHVKPGPVQALFPLGGGDVLIHAVDGKIHHTSPRAKLPDARFAQVYAHPSADGFFCGLSASGALSCWSTFHGAIDVALKGQFRALTMQRHFMCGLRKSDSRVACIGRPER